MTPKRTFTIGDPQRPWDGRENRQPTDARYTPDYLRPFDEPRGPAEREIRTVGVDVGRAWSWLRGLLGRRS